MQLDNIVRKGAQLPSIPRIAQQVLASVQSPTSHHGQIAALISADPVLAAKVLRLANSAFFSRSRKVATLDEALQLLGLAMVRNLVLGDSLVQIFRTVPGVHLQRFWRFNLYAAAASRWLAGQAGQDPELAFTLGLLQAIGPLQLHSAAPSAMVALNQQLDVLDAGRHALETSVLGFHHGDVSAALASAWQLPAAVTEALRHIAAPMRSVPFQPAAAVVHLGSYCARQAIDPLPHADWLARYPAAVAQALGLTTQWLPAGGRLGGLADLGGPQAHDAPAGAAMPDLRTLTQGLEDMLV